MKPTPNDPLWQLHKLYPRATENELEDLKKFLDEYLATCWKIYERIAKDPEAYAKFRAEILKKPEAEKTGLVEPKFDSSRGSPKSC